MKIENMGMLRYTKKAYLRIHKNNHHFQNGKPHTHTHTQAHKKTNKKKKKKKRLSWGLKLYHSIEIGEAINQSWGLCEALLESITEVVSRIGGDDEHRGANSGEKDGEDGAASGLANATFATNEDPFQSLLLHNVLQRSLWQLMLIRHGHTQIHPLSLSSALMEKSNRQSNREKKKKKK